VSIKHLLKVEASLHRGYLALTTRCGYPQRVDFSILLAD
jgi:hypothetical protein